METNNIYINVHLTAYNKKLFWLARQLRSAGYKFVWVKDGQVKVRKNEHSKVININTPDDIPKIATPSQQNAG